MKSRRILLELRMIASILCMVISSFLIAGCFQQAHAWKFGVHQVLVTAVANFLPPEAAVIKNAMLASPEIASWASSGPDSDR